MVSGVFSPGKTNLRQHKNVITQDDILDFILVYYQGKEGELMAAIIGCNGIAQDITGADLSLFTQKDFVAKIPSNDGSQMFKITNSDDDTCLEIKSNKNVKVYGNLYTLGKHVVINSEEVSIGDKFFTINADIKDSALNAPGGFIVKEVLNNNAQIISATAFNAAAFTITTDIAGTLVAGDLFYVVGSEMNDGLYKATTVNATSIIINTGATEYDTQVALIDETSSSASISEASPKMLVHDSAWKMIRYDAAAAMVMYKILGYNTIESGEDVSDTKPNIGCQGSTNVGSGASKVGLYNTALTKFSSPTQLQTFAEQVDGMIDVADGQYHKFGVAAIANTSSSVAVTFGTAFSTGLHMVVCTVEHIGGTPLTFAIIITAKAATGFTITLSGNTDDADYKLHWSAYGN